VPASSSASSSLSKLAGQFGGLASLAGINLSAGDSNDNSVVAMRILKTWDFLEVFIKENNIQAEVFAGNGWDSTKNKLLIDSDIYDQTSQKWTRKFDATKGEKAEPSSWELYEKIKDRISIVQEKSSGLISLSVVYYSPELAKLWTDELVKSINWHIQKQEREDAIKTIAYLNAKIKETNVADMQSVFYQLIEEQTKTLMLAEVSSEYVFKTISPAKVAEEHSKPRRLIIVIIGLLFGTFTGMVFVLIKSSR
jgi:capsular polysaccharide biosynthesis protein